MTRTSSNHRASERASIAHAPLPPLAELLAPRVYGAEDGGLGYQDLLGTPDAMVYITGQTLYFDAAATAELFWGGVSVATVPVAAGDFRTPTFAVPGARIAGTRNPIDDGYSGDGEHLVTYSYIYAGGRDDSVPATVRVKCSLPGGEDPVGATRDINENLAAPTITPSPVPDDPNIIVRVTFPRWKNIAAGDVVTVDWAGYKYPLPAITDPDQPQLPFATLLYDDIVRAGGGEHVPVSYYIYDVAGNWSKYAPYADPSVEIDPGTLTAPQLAEAIDNVLDLSQLGDADCTVRVGTRPLNPIDSVTVHWTSNLAAGGKKDYTFGPLGFDENNDPGTLLFTVPNAVALEAASGSLAIHYTALAGTSKTRRYRVSELAEVKLPAPIVPAANGSELDPFTGTPRDIEIHVPFDAKQMFQGDSVTMYVVGTRGAVTRYWEDAITLSSGDLQDPISFYCPADVLQAVENGAASFRYVVSSPKLATRGSFGIQATSRESETLTLQIRRAGAQPDLPPPIVVDVTDGVLDPELSRTRVQIPNSAATLPGKQVTLNWSGKVPYITQGTIPSSGLLEITINKPYIEGNKDSEVTVTYTLDGKTSEALTFLVGSEATVPPFQFDGSPITMESGESQLRQAAGGRPPYVYTSTNPGVAAVDANGLIKAIDNGTATISVRDSSQPPNAATCQVEVKRGKVITFESLPLQTIGSTWVPVPGTGAEIRDAVSSGAIIDYPRSPNDVMSGHVFSGQSTVTKLPRVSRSIRVGLDHDGIIIIFGYSPAGGEVFRYIFAANPSPHFFDVRSSSDIETLSIVRSYTGGGTWLYIDNIQLLD